MLLRAIQERRYRPVGDKADRSFNVRIIAATNEDLEAAVSEKRFRQDLLYRLHDFVITVPPLRDCQEAIMEGDSEIDREQKKIESLCFNLLMQQQPVARDLRTISAAMKMVTDIERIGDHAADISEMTILMSSDKPYRVNIEHVKSMASETMLMLIRAIEAYVEKNNDKAYIVMKQDDVVDDLFDKVKAELIDFIREHPEDGEQAEDLLMVAKYFERIGDHATNIAEWVEFALDDKVRKS
jgi:phosphate transport system protein